MVAILIVPIFVKQYFVTKTKGKMLVRVTGANEEEISYLLAVKGSTTEPNKKDRAYIPKGKNKTKDNELVGNTAEAYYPEGMPRVFQVRIRVMNAPEGSPLGINLYGSQESLLLTDHEVGVIHKEAFSAAAIAASNDNKDWLKEMKSYVKPMNKALIYVGLAFIVLISAATAYLTFQNGQAIEGLKNWFGW